MATNTELKRYAQGARRQLREQVGVRLEQVLRVDSVEVRERKAAVDQLKKKVAELGKQEVVDRVAYTWFNRFCALRYMDVNLYNPIRVVSPAPGNTQPEILQEAKGGYVPEELRNYVNKEKVFGLLNGTITSANGQLEAYRMLLVGVCNYYQKIMPFMFEEIEDYSELLMPQDLLSENSLLYQTREVLIEEECRDVEVIGWLYQYYISERKDEVFEQVKKGKKIEAEDIPAVTQLFTPHWIVRYLVENSLGRLWMLNHPGSKIVEQMEYYIKPVEEETDYLKVSNPEELKICDPACGSGHMLTYAFDLLYRIYEEQGYEPNSIPSLILQKNLFGIEIDGRAGALAAFAMCMKARSKDRRFLTGDVQPNICVLEDVSFTEQELKEYTNAVGRDLFTEPLIETLKQFEQASNFGSLIRPILTNPGYVRGVLEGKNLAGNILLYGVHEKVMKVLAYSEYLSSRYHVVVANPPYMAISSANEELKEFAKDYFSDSKTDLFAMFIERNLILSQVNGFVGMITMQSWMFLSSFEELRKKLILQKSIESMAHLGARAFDSIGGEVVSTTSFVLKNCRVPEKRADFIRLVDGKSEIEKDTRFKKAIKKPDCGLFYRVLTDDFQKIPGYPIAYWVSQNILRSFSQEKLIGDIAQVKIGMGTGKNEIFIRDWWEVNYQLIDISLEDVSNLGNSNGRYFPYNKGGNYRLWYGNLQHVLWFNSAGRNYMNTMSGHRENGGWNYYFKQGLTWSFISSSKFGVRFLPQGFIFDVAGSMLFLDHEDIKYVLGFLSSVVCFDILSLLNPTLNYQAGNIKSLPLLISANRRGEVTEITDRNISLSRADWDSYELSWEFTNLTLLKSNNHQPSLEANYHKLRAYWRGVIMEMQLLETQNNSIFIEAYGLKDELTPDVPIEEITLTCNPHYRYGPGKSEEEYERLQRADTMKEFISYAVGCMLGRYSLDKPGLILANQGETLQDYLKQVPDPQFIPDEDNAIPILGGDWFADDISERFRKFLKLTFGEEHYSENLQFIEEAIGRDIETYFLRDFYPYHVKMYKKRPIYWLFSSPKGTFNVLIYMHRYNKDTVSIILNNYLREFRAKLEARKSFVEGLSISQSATQRDRTAALKELEVLKKQLEEITMYEREVIFPLATKQIEIDLDDGVKVNYPKFGEALAKIKGLE